MVEEQSPGFEKRSNTTVIHDIKKSEWLSSSQNIQLLLQKTYINGDKNRNEKQDCEKNTLEEIADKPQCVYYDNNKKE